MSFFKLNLKEQEEGRSPPLSIIFDQLNLVFPFILKGRKLLQQLLKQNVKWIIFSKPVVENLKQWIVSTQK